jgi:hypothetical protein
MIRVAHPGQWLALALAAVVAAATVTEFAWPHPALDLQQSRLKLPADVTRMSTAYRGRVTDRDVEGGPYVLRSYAFRGPPEELCPAVGRAVEKWANRPLEGPVSRPARVAQAAVARLDEAAGGGRARFVCIHNAARWRVGSDGTDSRYHLHARVFEARGWRAYRAAGLVAGRQPHADLDRGEPDQGGYQHAERNRPKQLGRIGMHFGIHAPRDIKMEHGSSHAQQ